MHKGLLDAGADGWPLFAAVLGEGPLAVLMHGGGPDHRSLIPLAAELAADDTVALRTGASFPDRITALIVFRNLEDLQSSWRAPSSYLEAIHATRRQRPRRRFASCRAAGWYRWVSCPQPFRPRSDMGSGR